jgi:hypothetical protein
MEFNDMVVPTRILESKEINAIRDYLNESDPSKLKHLPYKAAKRLQEKVDIDTPTSEDAGQSIKSTSDSIMHSKKNKSSRTVNVWKRLHMQASKK